VFAPLSQNVSPESQKAWIRFANPASVRSCAAERGNRPLRVEVPTSNGWFTT
jgi:hypothetical protein